MEQVAVPIINNKLVILNLECILKEASLPMLFEQIEVVLQKYQFVERRNQEVSRAHCGVTNTQTIDDFDGFVVPNFVAPQVVLQLVYRTASPVVLCIEFIEYCAPYRLTADKRGNIARRKDSSVFMPIYFFKD